MELANREDIEADVAYEMSKLTRKQKAELARILGNPPVLSNVPEAYWAAAQQEREDILASLLLAMAMENAIRHNGMLSRDSRIVAERWALGRAKEVAQGHTARTREILARELEAGESGRGAIGKALDDARDEGLAATETTAGSVFGGEIGAAEAGIMSDEDIWELYPELSASGVCEICEPMGGTTRAFWSLYFPGGPPVHPNCKCRIRYMGGAEPQVFPKAPPASGVRIENPLEHPAIGTALQRKKLQQGQASKYLKAEQVATLAALDGMTLRQLNRRLGARTTSMPQGLARGIAATAKSAIALLAVSRHENLYVPFGDEEGWHEKQVGNRFATQGFLRASTTPQGVGKRHLLQVRQKGAGRSLGGVAGHGDDQAVFAPGLRVEVLRRERWGRGVLLTVQEI